MSLALPASVDDPTLNTIFTFLADVVAERKQEIGSGAPRASELEEGVVVFRRVDGGLTLNIKDRGSVFTLALTKAAK
tara:strand:+ start:146 stop:376 length:231 start_codon:yes stop_codon:yes gene_type:complete